MGIGGQLGSAAATGLAARSAAAQTLGQANAQSSLGSTASALGDCLLLLSHMKELN